MRQLLPSKEAEVSMHTYEVGIHHIKLNVIDSLCSFQRDVHHLVYFDIFVLWRSWRAALNTQNDI